jgi:tRNA G18 (ribose-2'-O)-methylase SpoU
MDKAFTSLPVLARGVLLGAVGTAIALRASEKLREWQLLSSSPSSSVGAGVRDVRRDDNALLDEPDLPLRLLSKAEGVLQYRSNLLLVIERCVNDFNYSAILRTAEALGVQDVWLIDPPPPRAASTGGDAEDEDEDGPADESAENDFDDESKRAGPGDSKSILDVVRSKRGVAKIATAAATAPLALAPQELESRKRHHLFAQKATEWLTVREFDSSAECLRALRDDRCQVWATDLSQAAVPLTVSRMPRSLPKIPGSVASEDGSGSCSYRIALVFGTEAVGVSREFLDNADLRVYLPLRGFADSLNLSVAAALVIHQVFTLYPDLVGNYPDKDGLRRLWFGKLASHRALGQRQKKDRKKLRCAVADCRAYAEKRARGGSLTREQQIKLARLPDYESRLRELDNDASSAIDTVEGYVRNPPLPLTDLRRADVHRVTYVGKATRKRHHDHWSGMAATANPPTRPMATAGLFRSQASSM